jgi:hypothetical protein
MAPSTLDRRRDHAEERRRLLVVMATIAVGIALLSCSAPAPSATHSSASAPVYESLGSVVRAPLSPPMGYQPPAQLSDAPAPSSTFVGSSKDGLETGAAGTWRESSRWAAIRGDGCVEVEQAPPQTNSAADAESAKFTVEDCSKEH